jgi:hypothetical protein
MSWLPTLMGVCFAAHDYKVAPKRRHAVARLHRICPAGQPGRYGADLCAHPFHPDFGSQLPRQPGGVPQLLWSTRRSASNSIGFAIATAEQRPQPARSCVPLPPAISDKTPRPTINPWLKLDGKK